MTTAVLEQPQMVMDFDSLFKEPAKAKPIPDSFGQVVQYLDGLCFGIAPNGRTVCLGTAADAKEAIAGNKRFDDPTVQGIINLERKLNAEGQIGKSEHKPVSVNKLRAVKARNQRIRLAQNAKHRANGFKRFKV